MLQIYIIIATLLHFYMEKLLLSKKIRITDFRISILKIFNKQSTALSIEEIETELGQFDRITLYRTIKLFKEKGILHEISIAGSTARLALCEQHCEDLHNHHHNHIHFHCLKCSEVYCLDVDAYPEVHLAGFQIQQVEIQASGICQKCA